MAEIAPFGPGYAAAYDLLYDTKDYDAECAFIGSALGARASAGTVRVLDLGCGTGAHALRLAALGCEVLGVDRAVAMLEQARAKAARDPAGARVRFEHGDIGSFRAPARYDVALMMFAVIGYQTDDPALDAALATARAHLAPGGLLIFDCWYGPAVLAQRPETRTKRVDHETGTLVRTARTDLDVDRHLCTVHYDLEWSPRGGTRRTVQERHVMRFFFSDELEQFLARAGFAMRRLVDFDAPQRAPSQASWNVWCVGEAV